MTKNKKEAKSEHREYIYVPDIADHKTRFHFLSPNPFTIRVIELSWSPGNLDVYMQYISLQPKQAGSYSKTSCVVNVDGIRRQPR